MKQTLVFLAIIIAAIWLWNSEATPVKYTVTKISTPVTVIPPDPRISKLTQFFTHYNCSKVSFDEISDYLHAADQNNLDYRILPAISVIESSCGRHYPPDTNNLWGWNSARTGFASIPEGIGFVSEQLAGGRHYAGKTIDQKLRAYNPNPAYAGEVERLMKEISQ